HQRALGLEAERLSSREIRRREPALGPVRGGLWVPGDHQVHNRRLLDALARAGARHGVALRAATVTAVQADGVDLADDGHIDADAVVVSAGVWSVDLHPWLPVRPVKGQILRLRATATALAPVHVVRGLDVYLVPRPDGEV